MPKDFSLSNMVQDLHYTINGTYVHEFLRILVPSKPDDRVLEPGCGSGKFGLSYALMGCKVDMFDIDPDVVMYACRLRAAVESLHGSKIKAHIECADIFSAVKASNYYDLVFNEGVPQHWQDDKRQRCIDRMVNWAKPGGVVVVIGNNGHREEEKIADREFSFKYMGMPEKRKCFTMGELSSRLITAGLEKVQTEEIGGRMLLAGWGIKAGG